MSKRSKTLSVLAIAISVSAAIIVGVVTFGGASFASGAVATRPTTNEGIKVEGDWRLEVRNPDGSTVLVQSFRNDPTNASQAIATILARAYTPSFWWITLSSTTGAGPACVSSGTPVVCRIIDPSDGGAYVSSPNSFKTLTTSNSGTQSTITLTGSMNAQRDGDVDTVSTNLSVCDRTVAPATACGTSSFWPFTSRTLSSPISLVTGQQLLVTVTLSFT